MAKFTKTPCLENPWLSQWLTRLSRRRFLLGFGALATTVAVKPQSVRARSSADHTSPVALTSFMTAQTETSSPWQPLPIGRISRIAFGSCAKQWQTQTIWQSVIDANPDVFLFIGDAIYADTDGVTAWEVSEGQLRGEWNRLADKPEFQAAQVAFPFMATWDNHDYGTHNGGAEFPLRAESREAFLDFFGEPADSERRGHEGVYDAKIFGPEGQRVQIILLDTRSFKGPFVPDTRSREERARLGIVGKYLPNNDPNITLLGNAQWAWLEEQLNQPAEVRLIASSTQIVADQKGMDEWGNYPHERHRLFELIERTDAQGVVLLSGNVHFAELSVYHDGAYPLYDFTSSGMTHVEARYAEVDNPYRVGEAFIDLNVGLIDIDWATSISPKITFKVLTVDGQKVWEKSVFLEDLQP